MFNNSRDAFAIAGKLLGNSINPGSVQEIEQAAEKLKEQKSVVQSYVMDEVFDKMGGGEDALAPYYAVSYTHLFSARIVPRSVTALVPSSLRTGVCS